MLKKQRNDFQTKLVDTSIQFFIIKINTNIHILHNNTMHRQIHITSDIQHLSALREV